MNANIGLDDDHETRIKPDSRLTKDKLTILHRYFVERTC